MSNKKLKAGLIPALIGILSLYLIFGGLLTLYIISDYIPFALAAIALLLPASLTTALCLFRRNISLKERVAKEKSSKLFVRILKAIGGVFVSVGRFFAKAYNKYRMVLKLLVIIGVFVGCHVWFATVFGYIAQAPVAIWQPIVVIVLFIIALTADKICLHTDAKGEFTQHIIKAVRTYIKVAYILLAAVGIVSTLAALSLWDIQSFLKYAIACVFYYVSAFAVISLAVAIIRKSLDTRPVTVIPIPFIKSTTGDLSIIDFLEQNTGITMRGLWSMRYVKQIAPITVIMIAGFLWLSTCIVQIDSTSQGAVYRLGVLQDELLQPGLHFVLPYPVDKVEIYNTESVSKVTIGYSSQQDTDNLWTGTHGDSEYKLLLGSGDEVVSINLRLEYKIKDLKAYLSSTSSPEQLLQAQAYELVTDRTIASDLATLLSTDRDAFAKSFATDLTKMLDGYDTGIEIVSVVLESIHPPLEIANVYQKIISAEIEAEQYIIEAQNIAAVTIAEAETERDTAIGKATADRSTRVAAANTEIAEFMAGVEAYKAYPDQYTYYKYLKAVSQAYGKANLVIVGDGVDSSKIYFGSFNAAEDK